MEHFHYKIEGWSEQSEQGELLKFLLEFLPKNNLRIAEIGVYQGKCTAMWNVDLINRNINYEYYAIDHFKGSSEHDKTIDYYSIALENLKSIKDRVHIIKNDSLSQSKLYPDKYFDIVYIDASHEYEHVKNDILHWLPKVKRGGVICGDDYVRRWEGVIRAVNEIFGEKMHKVGTQQWYVILP